MQGLQQRPLNYSTGPLIENKIGERSMSIKSPFAEKRIFQKTMGEVGYLGIEC